MRNLFNKKQAEQLTGVSSERVKLLVSEKLGEEISKKPRYKKKATIAIILAAALCITTAIAANSSWLTHYIFDDKAPDKISSEVEDINKSISDGEYVVTLEQALFGETTSYFIVSIEALTDEAFEKMENDPAGLSGFIFLNLELTLKYDGEYAEGVSSRELPELDNGRKKYIAIEYTGKNPKNSDLLVYTNSDKPDLYMRIPVKSSIKALDFKINQKVSNVVLNGSYSYDTDKSSVEDNTTNLTITNFSISPLDFTLEYKPENKKLYGTPINLIAFMMNDGSIHGQGEFLDYNEHKTIADYEQYIFTFKNIMEFDNIKAIIIDKTVYPLDKSKPYKLDKDMLFKPFISDGIGRTHGGFAPSIEDVCEKIGAHFSFDEKAQTVTITYNGKTTTLNIGTTNIKFANRATETEIITEIMGENIICNNLDDILGIEFMYINFNEQGQNGDFYIAP